MNDIEANSPVGRRIHVVGNSASGKSTFGMQLAEALDAPFVELDALNWQPGWVALHDTDPGELDRRILEATGGERWVVAGSYMSHSQRAFWDRLDCVIWLDLPMPLLLWRVLRRTWQRWRTRELLWGTNYERFWPQFLIWKKHESLLAWIVTQHARKRRGMVKYLSDPRWSHIRFVRLTSTREVEAFAAAVERAVDVANGADAERRYGSTGGRR